MLPGGSQLFGLLPVTDVADRVTVPPLLHLGRAGLAEPPGELLAVEHFGRHPIGAHRFHERRADRPADS
jgi:hypothetical protein